MSVFYFIPPWRLCTMFSSKSTSTTDLTSGVTIISKGCTFDGRLFCRGVSRIGGKITGEINAEGTLIIEKNAVILADIQSQVLVIQGSVKGNIMAKSKVELIKGSQLEGHVTTPSILVEEGTTLNASISMGTKGVPQKPDHVSSPSSTVTEITSTTSTPLSATANNDDMSARELGKIQVLRELSERKKRIEEGANYEQKKRTSSGAQVAE